MRRTPDAVRFVAIVGSRDWPASRSRPIYKVIEACFKETTVIVSGGAKGVDQLAATFARVRGYTVLEFPVTWSNTNDRINRYHFALGYYARNQAVAEACDKCVAFVTKDTGGTWDTIERVRKLGKPVEIVRLQDVGDPYGLESRANR